MAELNNPLSNVTTVPELLEALLNIVVTIAVPIVVLFIILAGFKYVTARGNEQQTAEARRALTYSIIGAVVLIGAFAILAMINAFVDAF